MYINTDSIVWCDTVRNNRKARAAQTITEQQTETIEKHQTVVNYDIS